jgi:hypothetical protein
MTMAAPAMHATSVQSICFFIVAPNPLTPSQYPPGDRGDRGTVQLAFMMGDTVSCGHAYVMAITNSAIGDPLGPSMTRPPTEAATQETPRRSGVAAEVTPGVRAVAYH